MNLSVLIDVVAFLVAFCLLVTVHEFGHFWVARRLGFKVLRFSVGFGKALWSRRGADGCEYVIASVPIGGYVKMLDEREGPVSPEDLPRSFTRRPHWQRIVVLLAGPGFNILFAIVLLTGLLAVNGVTDVRPVLGPIDPTSLVGRAGLKSGDVIVSVDGRPVRSRRAVLLDLFVAVSGHGPIPIVARSSDGVLHTAVVRIPNAAQRRQLTDNSKLLPGLGLQFYIPPIPAVLVSVRPGGPAARAGLRPGDRILAVDGEPIRDEHALAAHIVPHAGGSVLIRYRRGATVATTRVQVASVHEGGRTVGRIEVEVGMPPGATLAFPKSMLTHTSLSLPAAFTRASAQAWNMTALQAQVVWRMIIGRVSIRNLGGPLSIAEYAGSSAAAGVASFLSFLVLISLVLGFMNLLPIPILDGGQIVFQGIEWIKGSPLSERFQAVGQQLGMALLVLLMVVALFNDITRQFG